MWASGFGTGWTGSTAIHNPKEEEEEEEEEEEKKKKKREKTPAGLGLGYTDCGVEYVGSGVEGVGCDSRAPRRRRGGGVLLPAADGGLPASFLARRCTPRKRLPE